MSAHGTHCPHCARPAMARTSRQITPTLRETTWVCRNEYCGHVFVTMTEAVRTLSPAAIPNPMINLPFTPRLAPDPGGQLDLYADPDPPESSGQTVYRRAAGGWKTTPAR